MRCLLIAVVLLALVASARGPRWNELDGYTFGKFIHDFGRAYRPGSSEYNTREKNFNANLAEIRAHNADSRQTYKKGINHFADWSKEEFRAYNGNRPTKYKAAKASALYQPSGQPLPAMVDWRAVEPNIISEVKNQGACGNCWAHSATESIESYFALLTGQLPTLSTQQITSCTLIMDGCGGGDQSYGWMYVMNSTGLNEEWVYPFTDFFAVNETMQATAPCKNITKEFLPNFPWYPKAGVTGFARIASNDPLALVSALATIGPQSISVAASLWGSYEGGIYQNNGSNPANWEIDHAVQVVGYGHDYALSMDYWIVRNSWGTQWGEAGYIRLARYPNGEPCGIDEYTGGIVCGTSAILSAPDMPFVQTLEQLNP